MKASKSITSFLWRVVESCSTQIVSFIVSVVLARLIAPSAYGTLSIVTVFISLCSIFIDSGFGMALVQKKDADDLDFSSIFYFNVFMCAVLYALIFACSPIIAHFYKMEELTLLIRVQSITLLLSGVRSIQSAYVSKYLLFKQSFFATIGATVTSAIVGIAMAYAGFGIWALIAQSLFSNVVGTIILWTVIKWRPQKMFSFTRVKSMFAYGSKLLVSNLVNVGYNDLRQLIIGKVYTTADLAFFNRGATLPSLFNNVISNGINGVLLPTMSNVQDSPSEIKQMVRKSIRVQSYVLLPVFVGLAACADSLIWVLFTDTWAGSAVFLQIFCVMYMLESIAGTNNNALKAMGYSGKTLLIECIKTPLYTIILLLTMPYGTKAIAFGSMLGSFVGFTLCLLPAKKAYDYPIFEQIKDILPHLVLSAVMGICVLLVSLLPLGNYLTLIVQVTTGIVIYVVLSVVFRMECFHYVKDQLFALLHAGRK